ncbi:MAG: hypothetical protein AVDCRST_MAG08-4551, partial [uncultured Acetobacteraceae bacterium]
GSAERSGARAPGRRGSRVRRRGGGARGGRGGVAGGRH